MSNQPFNNEATPDERLQVHKDTMPKTTFASFAEAFADEDRGGRFKPETRTHVIGSAPIPKYPELPASSPSHHDPVPDERPLGYSIDEMQPLGTEAEVQASIDRLQKKPEDDGAA
jgi:hypothetical protein